MSGVSESPKDKVILALDVPTCEQAEQWIVRLRNECNFFKIGMELFLESGWRVVELIEEQGCRVMLDLKFHDIPRTVEASIRQLAGRGIDLATIHADAAEGAMAGKKDDRLKILAVTLLTSVDTDKRRAQDITLQRAEKALKAGCDGLVASAQETQALRERFGSEFILVTPGIRTKDSASDDQKRVASAGEALKAGSNYVVIGRPVLSAKDPIDTLQRIHAEIGQTLTP